MTPEEIGYRPKPKGFCFDCKHSIPIHEEQGWVYRCEKTDIIVGQYDTCNIWEFYNV